MSLKSSCSKYAMILCQANKQITRLKIRNFIVLIIEGVWDMKLCAFKSFMSLTISIYVTWNFWLFPIKDTNVYQMPLVPWKILFLAEVTIPWSSVLQCNCIVRTIFNRVPWKSTLKISSYSIWRIILKLSGYVLGTSSKSWTGRNFDLCL